MKLTSRRRLAVLLAFVLSTLGLLVLPTVAHAAQMESTEGPLVSITISPDLNCDVRYEGDSAPSWFAGTACGTFVSFDGALYGPATVPFGSGATGAAGYTPFTPVSQTAVTGDGTAASPFTITTVVALGATGIQLTQVDTYVVGMESYRTDVTLRNGSGAAIDALVYRGGDCYLQDSDSGLGDVLPGGAPVCRALPGSADPNRIIAFQPLTAGSRYIEAFYYDVWSAIGSQTPLPNTVVTDHEHDNGIALSWSLGVAASASATVSHLTVFSPTGATPVSFAKSADHAQVDAGASTGYTVTVSNPGAVAHTLTSITDTLPSGFSYVPGSTTGATTADPTVAGQDITWSGTFVVPAGTATTPGTLTLHFGVTASSVAGTYTNSVTGAGDGVTVLAALDTAPIEVRADVPVNPAPVVDAGVDQSVVEGSAASLAGTVTDTEPVTVAWTATAGANVDAGATCTFANPASASTTVTCTDDGTWTLTLTASDGTNGAVADSLVLTVTNAAPTVSITSPADTAVVATGAVTVKANVADAGSNDVLTCTVEWGDGASTTGTIADGVCTATHTYTADGAWEVTVTVTDDDGASASDSIILTTATTRTAKVTGGGFITTDGRVSFGFVAKSQADGTDGKLQVRSGKNKFHGTTVDMLTVEGNTATWSGTGRWNKAAGYTYTVTVVDNGTGGNSNNGKGKGASKKGDPDTFAVTITAPDGTVVYTSSGSLKGGNITVH